MVSILICFLSITYALWRQNFIGHEENEISTAKVSLELTDESRGIYLDKEIPVSDEVGGAYLPYTFKIRNEGTTRAGYNIYLRDDEKAYQSTDCSISMDSNNARNICLENKLDWNDIKFSVIEDDKEISKVIDVLGRDNGHIYTSSIKPNEIKSYKLRIWINSEADVSAMNKYFFGKISVEATPY